MELTIKQESFCQKFIETGNASEAYRQAYDSSNMKAETVNREAFALLENHKIATRVESLKLEHRARHNVSVDSLTTELDEARDLAIDCKNPSAAVSATTAKAKLHGLLIEKTQLETLNKNVDNSRLSDAEIEAIIIAERAKDKAKTH